MTRQRTGAIRKQPTERHGSSREALIDRICRAVAEGLSLPAAAARERATVETLKGWLAEDETFRVRYEKARAIGRTFVLDDVLALADSLPGTGRADIRLKLAARKWWIATVARDAAAQKKSVAELRFEAEVRAATEAAARAAAERERLAAEELRHEMFEEVQFLKSSRCSREFILEELNKKWPGVPLPPSVADELPRLVKRRPSGAPAPERKPAAKAASTSAPKHETAAPAPVAPETAPSAPAAAAPPAIVPPPKESPAPVPPPPAPPKPKPRSIYDLSARPQPVEHKTMADWDALNSRSF